MRIIVRDQNRRRIGRIEIDPSQRPTRVNAEAGSRLRALKSGLGDAWHAALGRRQPTTNDPVRLTAREVFLNWDIAVDDAGQLRRCVACGCEDLFKEKAFPQVTGFVVVMAFVGAVVGALGLATNLPVLIMLVVILVLDVAILVFSKRRLVCYRCRSSYHDLAIARYHRPWDRATADRYLPAPSSLPPQAEVLESPAATAAKA